MINSDSAFHLFSRHLLRDYWVPNTILRIKSWIIDVVWPWEAYSRVEMNQNWCIIYISSPSFYDANPEGCGGFSGTKAYTCLEMVGVNPSDGTSEGPDDHRAMSRVLCHENAQSAWYLSFYVIFLATNILLENFVHHQCQQKF